MVLLPRPPLAPSAIEEIPEDIDEILDRQVEDVCSKVNGSINEMQFIILKAGHYETDGVVRTWGDPLVNALRWEQGIH